MLNVRFPVMSPKAYLPNRGSGKRKEGQSEIIGVIGSTAEIPAESCSPAKVHDPLALHSTRARVSKRALLGIGRLGCCTQAIKTIRGPFAWLSLTRLGCDLSRSIAAQSGSRSALCTFSSTQQF